MGDALSLALKLQGALAWIGGLLVSVFASATDGRAGFEGLVVYMLGLIPLGIAAVLDAVKAKGAQPRG